MQVNDIIYKSVNGNYKVCTILGFFIYEDDGEESLLWENVASIKSYLRERNKNRSIYVKFEDSSSDSLTNCYSNQYLTHDQFLNEINNAPDLWSVLQIAQSYSPSDVMRSAEIVYNKEPLWKEEDLVPNPGDKPKRKWLNINIL